MPASVKFSAAMTSIVTETDVEKMQKKMAKQHAHELRTLEQKKKKQAKAIKDKAKRMELYKMFSAEEEKLKARHVAEMTELLSGASIAEKEIAEHDEVVATNSSETGEEAKIRKKKEKAAKKRQAKLEKEKAETEKLQAERGAQVDYRALENEAILSQVSSLGLSIHDVKADGHCLFRSVAHQLQQRKDGGSSALNELLSSGSDLYLTLRKASAQHIRDRESSYAPFLAMDNKRNETFFEYCHRMENTSDWGGELELRALSEVLENPIQIFCAETPPILMGEDQSGEPLKLSYHKKYYALGMHYNSLI